jgi:hypothetical protein
MEQAAAPWIVLANPGSCRHPREGGDPWTLLFKHLMSMDSRRAEMTIKGKGARHPC